MCHHRRLQPCVPSEAATACTRGCNPCTSLPRRRRSTRPRAVCSRASGKSGHTSRRSSSRWRWPSTRRRSHPSSVSTCRCSWRRPSSFPAPPTAPRPPSARTTSWRHCRRTRCATPATRAASGAARASCSPSSCKSSSTGATGWLLHSNGSVAPCTSRRRAHADLCVCTCMCMCMHMTCMRASAVHACGLPCICICHAYAMHMPCICRAYAVHMPCICRAYAMHMPCSSRRSCWASPSSVSSRRSQPPCATAAASSARSRG